MIDFSAARWEKTVHDYESFWRGELNRPIFDLVGQKSPEDDKRGTPPDTPYLSQSTCHLDLPPVKWMEAYEYDLAGKEFLGDSFPQICLDSFGPGVAAAFLGARLDNSTGRVWFHPKEHLPIKDLHFEYDPNNFWFNKIRDLMDAAARRWQGEVLVGLPDFGGVLDILSTFLPGEELLLALYDEPEEVIRCCEEIQALWFRYYDELADVVAPTAKGHGTWAGFLIPGKTNSGYIYQCDFCYMIGPDMFETFVLPSLKADCKRTACNSYHLDGTGELPHLDMLLSIPDLHLVQWVPGDGSAPEHTWTDVHRRILRAGKHIQLHASGLDILPGIFDALGENLNPRTNAVIRGWCGAKGPDPHAFIEKMSHVYEGRNRCE